MSSHARRLQVIPQKEADHSPQCSLTVEGPRYIKGHATTLSLVGMATVVYGLMSVWYMRENKRRDAAGVGAAHEGQSDDELAELGDESPHYRFVT